MRMRFAAVFQLLMLSLIIAAAGASTVRMTEPYNATIMGNSTVYLGKVGPGQTFYVTISANTTNSTGAVFQRGWNELLATDLPRGWIAENSSLYNAYLSVKVTPPADAENGTYYFNLTAVNAGNYSKLGAAHFIAEINVTPNVFKLQVSPSTISTGPGEPTTIYITINNTGVSDNPFLISAQGLPAWNLTKEVIALHHTSEVFQYPLYQDEPGVYQAVINVTSTASPLVTKRSTVNLTVQASVLNDYAAVGEGAVGFPIIYEPIYAIMQLISRLFHSS
jgi:hypothetical protein